MVECADCFLSLKTGDQNIRYDIVYNENAKLQTYNEDYRDNTDKCNDHHVYTTPSVHIPSPLMECDLIPCIHGFNGWWMSVM